MNRDTEKAKKKKKRKKSPPSSDSEASPSPKKQKKNKSSTKADKNVSEEVENEGSAEEDSNDTMVTGGQTGDNSIESAGDFSKFNIQPSTIKKLRGKVPDLIFSCQLLA